MIKFAVQLSQEEILERAKKYFDKSEYWAYVNYISDKFELCSPKIKSMLLSMLGHIYLTWQSYDKAILASQFSLRFDETNGDAMLCLARAYREIGDDFAFKETFMTFSFNHEDRIFDDISLIEYFNNLNQDFVDEGLTLVSNNLRYKYMIERAKELMEDGDFESAVQCYEEILKKFPNKLEAYNTLGFIYRTVFEDEKYQQLVQKRFQNFPEDLETIALYLFVNKNIEDSEREELYQKLLDKEICSIGELKSVCCVAEYFEDYLQCLKLIDEYGQNYNCMLNHDLLVMKYNTLLKLDELNKAKKLLPYLNITYGIFGLGNVCKYLLECEKEEISISNINYMPDELWCIAGDIIDNLNEDFLNGEQISDERYWTAFELLIMSADEEDIRDFLVTYKEQFTLKNQTKIGAIIYMRDITDIVKTGVLVGLLSCEITDFSFYQNSKIVKETFCYIEEIEDYPECYKEAYYYAFAYCGLSLSDFSNVLHTSTLELLEAMSETKRKFRDQFALAGAIICNTYLVLGDDVEQEVARMIECNVKRLKRYIKIIKKEGEFFDLNDDDMFEMLIKRISNKLIIPDSIDD